MASDAPVAMTHGLFCQHATAPASPGILASGDWSVGHFVARAPKLGSDLDVSAATVVAHADRVFTDGQWLFAHDGSLGAYEQLEPTLWAETEPQLRPHRSGESESELVFLWLLSRLTAFGLREPRTVPLAQLVEGVREAVHTLAGWAKEAGATGPAGLTLVLTDGVSVIAARQRNPLYWLERATPERALLLASEPLGDEGWRPALDGMVLAAGADARLV